MASLCLLGHLHTLELPMLAAPELAPIMARIAPVLSSLHNYKVRRPPPTTDGPARTSMAARPLTLCSPLGPDCTPPRCTPC